ncbi:MAG TPA: glycosyltransferase family 2 protein, partial [Candidatus Humimicrobiaceae bacterium]
MKLKNKIMKKVSCIIPAYNEGERIEKILNIIIGHPLIYEIIVIDDGSKDNTKEIIEKFEGITFIKHEKNQGKSISVYDGIVKATGEYILMLDADLIGL